MRGFALALATLPPDPRAHRPGTNRDGSVFGRAGLERLFKSSASAQYVGGNKTGSETVDS